MSCIQELINHIQKVFVQSNANEPLKMFSWFPPGRGNPREGNLDV